MQCGQCHLRCVASRFPSIRLIFGNRDKGGTEPGAGRIAMRGCGASRNISLGTGLTNASATLNILEGALRRGSAQVTSSDICTMPTDHPILVGFPLLQRTSLHEAHFSPQRPKDGQRGEGRQLSYIKGDLTRPHLSMHLSTPITTLRISPPSDNHEGVDPAVCSDKPIVPLTGQRPKPLDGYKDGYYNVARVRTACSRV